MSMVDNMNLAYVAVHVLTVLYYIVLALIYVLCPALYFFEIITV